MANTRNFLKSDEVTRLDFNAFVDEMIVHGNNEIVEIPPRYDVAKKMKTFQQWLEDTRDLVKNDEHARLVQAGFFLGLSMELADQANRRKPNIENAQVPRGPRGKTAKTKLWEKGFRCVREQFPGINFTTLCDKLEMDPLTYDDDDIELRLSGDSIQFRDLGTNPPVKTATIKKSTLRKHL